MKVEYSISIDKDDNPFDYDRLVRAVHADDMALCIYDMLAYLRSNGHNELYSVFNEIIDDTGARAAMDAYT